ncbi:GDSL esterase/lipase At1g28600-like [Vicia villosa]|uniref:GDSL esterase/lipase At1g28600-like n=1 Tax=Vicia villosa TaxID=3911 RepID=UPI00273A9DCA|nr:GDSL esterase/lipase At1g28600-like [Vicia villosa]
MKLLFLFLMIMASTALVMATCPSYSSIFSFGDSVTDTGNRKLISSTNICSPPPYGQTYFHHPTGRCSDGRLIIDFIAESLGIPMVKPYLEIKNGVLKNNSAKEGANFAVVGATALDDSFFKERGAYDHPHSYSLSIQLNWFKELLSTLCNSSESCHEVLKNSLFLVGEIGGNDFNYPLFKRRSIEEVKEYIPHIIKSIVSSIKVRYFFFKCYYCLV